jgi:flagellar biosynthesis chaperone FliJ
MSILWPNERIMESLIELASTGGDLSAEDIMFFIHGMRDEYEQKLTEAAASRNQIISNWSRLQNEMMELTETRSQCREAWDQIDEQVEKNREELEKEQEQDEDE